MWDVKGLNLKDYDFNLKNVIEAKEFIRYNGVIAQHGCCSCWTPCEAFQSILSNWKVLLFGMNS